MTHISRRNFLKRSSLFSGGLALSGAFPGVLRAAEGDNRKLVIVSLGHSLDPGSDYGTKGWFTAPNADGTIAGFVDHLAPLAEFKDKLAIVSGCSNFVARMVQSNGHNASSRTLLTCRPHKGFKNYGDSLDASSSGGGASLEYFLAERFNSIPLTLRCGRESAEHRRCFIPDGSDDQGAADPVVAYEKLFAGAMASEGLSSTAQKLRAKRGQIIATVRDSYDSMSSRAGVDDRERLQSHATLLNYFLKESEALGSGVADSCSSAGQDIPEGYSKDFDQAATGRDDDIIGAMHNSLLATALGCGTTRVASLHYSNIQSNQFPFLNGGKDLIAETGANWHAVCHHDAGSDALRTKVATWYTEMWVDLLRKLENTPDVNGSVLDNTIVLFTTSLGNRSHGVQDIPYFIAGGANTGLKTNFALDLAGDRRTTADMYTTILQLMGQPDETFGVTGTFQGSGTYSGLNFNNGPIKELMV